MSSMLLCSCEAVSERTIRAAIASGARTPQEIARRCGAGSRCGGCWPALQALLDEAEARDLPANGRGRHAPSAA
jgi:bacterioferritin-associated ferredoxin